MDAPKTRPESHSFFIAPESGISYRIEVHELTEHDPEQIRTLIDIDLMTWSEPTWSRYTAALLMRYGRVFILTADGVPIGTCACKRSWERPSEAVLFSMAIRPGFRGHRLGHRFLQQVLERLQRHGIRSVVLNVDADNVAGRKIYEERFGFELFETVEAEYGRPGEQVRLRKVLSTTAEIVPLKSPPPN